MRHRDVSSALLNGLVAALAAVLLGFSILLKTRLIIISDPGDSFVTLKTDPSTWNIGITIVGSIVGILASIAFSAQDGFLSRLALASEDGVAAIFLRPLTTKRGLQQMFSGHLSPERTALVILTLGTALSSAAAVAMLSVRTTVHEVTNPTPSFPLAFYNSTQDFDMTGAQGGIYAILISVATLAPYLTSFVYRSAFINGQAAAPPMAQVATLPEEGLLGKTTYSDLWTSGVGINANSYETFSGPSSSFPIPLNYTFASLSGFVYGTAVNVTCSNRTSSYSIDKLGSVADGFMVTASKAGVRGPTNSETNITMYIPTNVVDLLPMGFNLTSSPESGSPETADPIHVILVSDMQGDNAQVFECSYEGRELVVEVSIASPGGPLVVGQVVDQGPFIGPAVKKLIATNLHEIINGNGGGSVLSKAFVDANYNNGGDNTTAQFGQVLSTVLSQSAQAVISVLRQPIEIANLYEPPPSLGASVVLSMKIQRVGGGSWGWLAVFGVLLLGSLIGLGRALIGGEAVAFEAQDAVILLGQTLGDGTVKSKTKVRMSEGGALVFPTVTASHNT